MSAYSQKRTLEFRGFDPQAYLRDMLARIANHPYRRPIALDLRRGTGKSRTPPNTRPPPDTYIKLFLLGLLLFAIPRRAVLLFVRRTAAGRGTSNAPPYTIKIKVFHAFVRRAAETNSAEGLGARASFVADRRLGASGNNNKRYRRDDNSKHFCIPPLLVIYQNSSLNMHQRTAMRS